MWHKNFNKENALLKIKEVKKNIIDKEDSRKNKQKNEILYEIICQVAEEITT